MRIESTNIQVLKYIFLDVLSIILVMFLMFALSSNWIIENGYFLLSITLLIIFITLSVAYSIHKAREYQLIIEINDTGLQISHKFDKSLNQFYSHENYFFSIKAYRIRRNMITVLNDITLNIYSRSDNKEFHYDLRFLSDKEINEFNTLATRFQRRYEKEEKESSNNTANFNDQGIVTEKSLLKDSVWTGVLMLVMSLVLINQFLLRNISWIWGTILTVFTISIIHDRNIKKPKEALTKIQVIDSNRLILEKNGITMEYFLDEIDSIQISTPGSRRGYRRIILKTNQGTDYYHYGLLAKTDLDEDYHKIIDLLFAFADDKVSYID